MSMRIFMVWVKSKIVIEMNVRGIPTRDVIEFNDFSFDDMTNHICIWFTDDISISRLVDDFIVIREMVKDLVVFWKKVCDIISAFLERFIFEFVKKMIKVVVICVFFVCFICIYTFFGFTI